MDECHVLNPALYPPRIYQRRVKGGDAAAEPGEQPRVEGKPAVVGCNSVLPVAPAGLGATSEGAQGLGKSGVEVRSGGVVVPAGELLGGAGQPVVHDAVALPLALRQVSDRGHMVAAVGRKIQQVPYPRVGEFGAEGDAMATAGG